MKVVNFQLDSADPLFIYSHLDDLPFLRAQIHQGVSGVLRTYGSSSVSWTSFWTAHHPRIHGVSGFWREQGIRYRSRCFLEQFLDDPGLFLNRNWSPTRRAIRKMMLRGRPLLMPVARLALSVLKRNSLHAEERIRTNRSHIKLPTGYQVMEKCGLKVGLINCIYTYPVWPISGYLVSDWTMPANAERYAHPPELENYLNDVGYKKALDDQRHCWGFLEGTIGDDPEEIYRYSVRVFELTKEATIYTMTTFEWDFHATMFRFLDTIQHVFIDDETRVLQAYQMVDAALAEIADRVGLSRQRVYWLINSDHGASLYYPGEIIKGGHDLSGFYCFVGDNVFPQGLKRTIDIEELMPVVLYLFGIDPLKRISGRLRNDILAGAPDEMEDVEQRLRGLGYL